MEEKLERAILESGKRAVAAVHQFLKERGAGEVYARVSSPFNYGGELCDGPFAILKAEFTTQNPQDIIPKEDEEGLAQVTIRRWFGDGFKCYATLMYSFKNDKAYFFGG